jgi:hypothetical protein
MINIERRIQAPASLADKKSWRGKDVLQALFEDFREKCYLTERKFDDPEEMEIDHFVTRNENEALHYEWTNLYPIHEKANKKRPKTTPVGGFLNPCSQTDNVEEDVEYRVEIGGGTLFKPRDLANQKAVNTAQLLTHIHQDLKGAIRKKHHEVVNAIAEWRTAVATGRTADEYEEELLLRTLLSRDSSFTMLMRSMPVVKDLPPDFLD